MVITNPQDIGRAIAERRREAGWSVSELADRIGASPQWVRSIERKDHPVRSDLMLQAMYALGLDINLKKTPQAPLRIRL